MKNILSYLLIAASLTLTCCAQADKKTTKPPVPADTVSPKTVFPLKAVGWVSDFDKLFSPEQVAYLDSMIARHEQETSNEIAIVTYQPDSTQLAEAGGFERFSLALFKEWGVGKKEKNNGVGLLIATNLRKVRIETGLGLESKLTDEEAQAIVDRILVPAFKENDRFNGVRKALEAIMDQVK